MSLGGSGNLLGLVGGILLCGVQFLELLFQLSHTSLESSLGGLVRFGGACKLLGLVGSFLLCRLQFRKLGLKSLLLLCNRLLQLGDLTRDIALGGFKCSDRLNRCG
jgi:hypothetical protein